MPLLESLKSLWTASPRGSPAAAVKSAYPAGVAFTFGTSSYVVPSLDDPHGGGIFGPDRLRSNTVVVICNAWYATNFPTARPQVGRIESDTGEFVPLGAGLEDAEARQAALDHPALRWLAGRPNPFFTWRQTWAATLEDFNTDGNAFWLKAGGDPYEIYWLPRCRVNVVASAEGSDTPVSHYEYTNPRGKVEKYDPSQVAHFRDGIDPDAPHLGLSRLRRLAHSLAAIDAGEIYAEARSRNGHNGVLITPKDGGGGAWGGSPEEVTLRQIADRTNRGLSGPEAGRAQWASLPVDVHRFGDSGGDSGIDLLMNRHEMNIAAALGLNTMVLGLASSSFTKSYANYAEADRQAWYNGVIPRQDAFAEVVTDSILRPDFGDDLVMAWDRSWVAALNEDTDAKVKRAIDLRQPDAFGKPLAGLNEARDLCDLPPVEGGDLTPVEEFEAVNGGEEGAEGETDNEGADDGGEEPDDLLLDGLSGDAPAARPDLADPTEPPDTLPMPARRSRRLRAAKSLDGVAADVTPDVTPVPDHIPAIVAPAAASVSPPPDLTASPTPAPGPEAR